MFIDLCENGGKPYLRLVKSVRVENKQGKKVSQKMVLMNIGPLSKYDDGKPEYMERLRKSMRAGQPIIPELEEYCDKKGEPERYKFEIYEGEPMCVGHPKVCSQLLIEKIIEEMGLRNVFSTYKGMKKIEYDVYGFAKLLIYGRILEPASKIATVMEQNGRYYSAVLKGHNPDNVYDTLSFISEHKDQIIRRINTNIQKKMGRRGDIIYYDVTNLIDWRELHVTCNECERSSRAVHAINHDVHIRYTYYEIEQPDEDKTDEEGKVLEKGMRKLGVCKEERKQPIVQMGLFMDERGIPMAIEAFPGNTLDHLTLRPALERNIDGIEMSRYILISDRGICYYPSLLHAVDCGNGYIIAKSLAKSKKAEREWAYSDEGYIADGPNFKYKSRVIRRTVTDENGEEREIVEKVIAYWSRKYYDKSRAEHKSFLDMLELILESPQNFRVSVKSAKSLRKFLSGDLVNMQTGEMMNSSDIKALIDPKKVEEFTQGFGYYQLVTSELLMDPKQVIEKYHGLSQIENQFRIMKGDLSTRPLYVRNPDHIVAHLLICMIALLILRIIQIRIVDFFHSNSPSDDTPSWSIGMPGERIQYALNNWLVDLLPGDRFRFMNIDNGDLKSILDAFGISIPLKLFSRAELKSIKSNINIFM